MDPQIVPFDWYRMFVGDHPPLFLLELAFRVAIMYLWALLVLHFVGKRGRQQMSPLEYLVVVAMGSASGDPMFYPEVPLLYGMATIAGIVAMTRVIAFIQQRVPALNDFNESSPVILVYDGQILRANMRREAYTRKDLLAGLRAAGIKDLGEVHLAILEITGTLSVFRRAPHDVVAVEDILLEPK